MEQTLGTIQTYGTLSGYIYLHLPEYICKAFNIQPKSKFTAVFCDGKIILKQEVEDATKLGIGSATSS